MCCPPVPHIGICGADEEGVGTSRPGSVRREGLRSQRARTTCGSPPIASRTSPIASPARPPRSLEAGAHGSASRRGAARSRKRTDDEPPTPTDSLPGAVHHQASRGSVGVPDAERTPLSVDEERIPGQLQLDANLANLGLRRVEVPGDGDCQFHAMSDQLRRAALGDWNARQLRMKAVKWLGENREKFTECLDRGRYPDFDAYLRQMNQHEWGDELTLRALSTIFNVKVIVVSSDSAYRPTIEPHDVSATEPVPLHLGHYHEFHYVSTAPMQSAGELPCARAAAKL